MEKRQEEVTLTKALGTSERTRIFGFTKFEVQKRRLFKYTICILGFLHVVEVSQLSQEGGAKSLAVSRDTQSPSAMPRECKRNLGLELSLCFPVEVMPHAGGWSQVSPHCST